MTTTPNGKAQRPTGSLGKLFDESAALSDTPLAHLEEIARQALSDGSIDERWYRVLQNRLPFSGFERKSLEGVAKILDEGRYEGDRVTRERVRQLEGDLYEVLTDYLRMGQENEGYSLGLHRLPWRRLHGQHGTKTYHVLKGILSEEGKPITVGSLVELYEEAAQNPKVLLGLRNYDRAAIEITYGICNSFNIGLPKVKVPNK